MVGERFIVRDPSGGVFITNLGAIAAAQKITDFLSLSRKAVRIIVYDGASKTDRTTHQVTGNRGYAIGFRGLLKYVMDLFSTGDVTKQGLRENRTLYAEIALREIIANALIHQDFTITGAGPLIEVFKGRVEISNPGGLLPSKTLDRLIGTQPESRNEQLARAFRRYRICEELGSGLLQALREVDAYGLPPIHFVASANQFKVTLHAPRTFAHMSRQERLDACYQHAVSKHFSDSAMTNKSLRNG